MAQITFSNDWLELLADPYAVLGISLTADEKSITKHYRRLAMQLHPDRYAQAEPKQREFAGHLVARLVNPAYGKLKQARDRAELMAVLRLHVQQQQKNGGFVPTSEAARMLMQQPAQSALSFYEAQIQQLADQQYESFTQFGNVTHQLHELNLAYIQRKLDATAQTPAATISQTRVPDVLMSQVPSATPNTSAAATGASATGVSADDPILATAGADPLTAPTAVPKDLEAEGRTIQEGYALRHYERAQQYIEKGAYAGAVQEMKDALRMASDKAEYHALLSYAYLLQDLPGMAKVYCRQALKLDPEDKMALKLARKLKIELKAKAATAKKSKAATAKKRSLLGGLFSR